MLSAIIIEDEKLAREVLISLLEQFFGNKINILGEASNVKQGISLIQKYQPQLVFLDIQLRGVTGFDLFNHFEEPRSFEVVFTTAHKEHAIKAIRSGAFDYNILNSTGRKVLDNAGNISHTQATEKAKSEYQKYKSKTLSSVEKEYLKNIATLEQKVKKGGKKGGI